MKQGFQLGQKTKRVQVICHQGKQKEVVALAQDKGLSEAIKYYKHMEKYRQFNLEVLGM